MNEITEIRGDIIKTFSCPCQSWTIRQGDSRTPAGQTFLVHDCEKVKVLQEHKGIKRFYLKKNEPKT